jgi:hypothetical protein
MTGTVLYMTGTVLYMKGTVPERVCTVMIISI